MSAPVIYFDLGNTLIFGSPGNWQPFDDAVATIEELWFRGYKIGLLSDQSPGTTEQDVRQLLDDFGLESFRFDVITISSEFSPPVYKPDPLIFETAITKAGHASPSNNTVFVTENLSHIEAARDLGWRAIHKPFEASCTPSSGECVADLDDLLDLFPQLAVDIYIRDAANDPGDDQFTGSVFWNSPDLWIRNQEDGGLSHQSPEFGQDNWFYTRVHNRGVGIARIFQVIYSVQQWAGTQFVYPGDYTPFLAQTFGINLEPDTSAIVWALWPENDIPAEGTHACWLAAAHIANDFPVAGAHVWEHNNLAQKNLVIVDLVPGESGGFSLVLGSRQIKEARYYTVELYRSQNAFKLPVTLEGQSAVTIEKLVQAGKTLVGKKPTATENPARTQLRFLETTRVDLGGADKGMDSVRLELERGSTLSWGKDEDQQTLSPTKFQAKFIPASAVRNRQGETYLKFAGGRVSGIGVGLKSRQIVRTTLNITAPKSAKPGEFYDFEVVQRGEDGRIEGGVSVRVNIRQKTSKKAGKNKAAKARTVKASSSKTRRKKS